MRWLSILHLRVRSLFRRSDIEQDLEDELQFHVDELTARHVARGLAPDEARRLARRETRGFEAVKDWCRDTRRTGWLDDATRDVVYALRTLGQRPAFAVVTVLTLALGIGANTAIFSIVDGALLHPIPFAGPERLVAVYATSAHGDRNAISYPNFLDWQQENHTFEALAAWRADAFTLTGRGPAEQIVGVMVSAHLFSTLRVPPLVGRTFAPDEDRRGAAPVALLGESFWIRRFDRDPHIVGQPLVLNGRAYSVIGVIPSKVRLDRADGSSFANDVFIPIGLYDDALFLMRGAGTGTRGLGRLRAGTSLAQAQADMNIVAADLARAYPESNRGVGVNVITLEDAVVGDARRVLWMLLCVVGFVLLIACANVANLSLARSLSRAQEFAVRRALGAGRGRLVRQLLTESLILAIAGGTLGIGLGTWFTTASLGLLATALPVMSQVELNVRVLSFAVAVSLATGLLFGLAPAWHASQPHLDQDMRARGRGVTEQSRAQRLLVVGQVALTLVLLVGSGLMIRSLVYLLTGHLGFDPQGVLIMRTGLPAQRRSTPAAVRTALSDLNERLASIPGVEAASVQVGSLPFTGETALVSGEQTDPNRRQPARCTKRCTLRSAPSTSGRCVFRCCVAEE